MKLDNDSVHCHVDYNLQGQSVSLNHHCQHKCDVLVCCYLCSTLAWFCTASKASRLAICPAPMHNVRMQSAFWSLCSYQSSWRLLDPGTACAACSNVAHTTSCASGEAGQQVEVLCEHNADLEQQISKTSAALLKVCIHSLHA
jgi:hypothetical protein